MGLYIIWKKREGTIVSCLTDSDFNENYKDKTIPTWWEIEKIENDEQACNAIRKHNRNLRSLGYPKFTIKSDCDPQSLEEHQE